MKVLRVVAMLFILLSCASAQATLIRVSDGALISNLATETSTVWKIEEDGALAGKLLGAYNVNVAGTLYDVVFRDGTFNSVFGTVANLDATSLAQATLFSTALINSVFLDNSYAAFNRDPFNTFGCSGYFFCQVYTLYRVASFDMHASIAINRNAVLGNTNSVSSTGPFSSLPRFINLSNEPNSVFADWSLTPTVASTVPEPAAMMLMLLGLVGLSLSGAKLRLRP